MKRESIGHLIGNRKPARDPIKAALTLCEKSLEELSDDMDAGIVQDHAQWLKMWNVWTQRRDSLRRGVMVYW